MDKSERKPNTSAKNEKDDPEVEEETETQASSSVKSKGSAKKRKVYQMDPRSPLKRQRIKIERFQSPMTEDANTKPKMIKEEIIVLYKKGTFIAVRGAEESFYLCRSLQNVQNTTKRFRIQWLSLDQEPNIYKLDYIDQTEFACVLTNVKMDRIAKDTYRLPHNEQVQAQKVLEKAIKVENGLPIEDEEMVVEDHEEEDDYEEEEEEEENWEDVETPAKRRKTAAKGKSENGTSKSRGKRSADKSKGKTKSQKDKGKKVQEKKKKVVEKKERKKGPDRNLKPNPKIKVLEKDPFFETKEKVPFISIPVYSKLVIRAAVLNDVGMLKDLVKDEKTYKVYYPRSVGNTMIALNYALINGNKEMIKILLDETFPPKDRKVIKIKPPQPLLSSIDTGEYNPVNLGIRSIRKLNVSRGSRQGNDAFSEDTHEPDSVCPSDFVQELINLGCDWDIVDCFISSQPKSSDFDREELLGILLDNVEDAVIHGQRKLAARLVEEAEKRGGLGFNFLHKEVLSFDKEDLRQNVMAISVRKKPLENSGITPVHCAAINPNIKYLSRLISIEPDINVMDKNTRRPIHFAAACEGTEPLEFLLKRGASPFEIMKDGKTALHCACVAGRSANVDLLIKKGTELESSFGQDAMVSKWGNGGIDRPCQSTYTALHLAVTHFHTEVVRVLIKHGANLNRQLSAGKEKLSALMIAAATGQLEIVRMLVQAGATVELLDKFKRTALTHAIKNGNTHVASYLLYLGADPNRTDSSGNTLVHYAAAYGWYFCLKLLIKDAGADAAVANHWKTTPLSIAFLKGHIGIVDFILSEIGGDINFTDDEGVTLVCLAASSHLVEGLVDQIKYLVKEKGANPALADIRGQNALHRVASNRIPISYLADSKNVANMTVEMAKMFIEGGCDPNGKDKEGKSPIMMAITMGNHVLIKYLLEVGGCISADVIKNGNNVLHLMAEQCAISDMGCIIEFITKKETESKDKIDESGDKAVQKDDDSVKNLHKMVHAVNHSGYTPLLRACKTYVDQLRQRSYYRSDDNEQERKKKCAVSFIKAVITCLKADINDTVQKLHVEDELGTGINKDKYSVDGKYSAVHMLVNESNCQKNPKLLDCLKLFLEYKPNLELKDTKEQTPLAMAAVSNQQDIVKLLLKSGAKANVHFNQNTTTTQITTSTPLLQAAEHCNEIMIEDLVNYGADTKAKHTNGQTALHFVANNRSDEAKAVKLTDILLSHGAEINAVCNKKRTPFHLAVSSNQGTANSSTDLEELMISKGANLFAKDIRGRTPLHYVFVQIGCHKDHSSLDPIDLCSLLTSAMGGNHLDEVDVFKQTPLHRAAIRGGTICCMHLIQRKANINTKDQMGNTPLSLSILNRHISCAILLIQLGSNCRDTILLDTKPSSSAKPVTELEGRPVLIWRPIQKLKKCPELVQNNFPVFQESIRSDLQGVAHMLLEKTGIGRTELEDTITVSKYNVALRLMKRVTNPKLLQESNNKRQNLFHTLLIKSIPGADVSLQLKVAERLLNHNVAINQADEYGCTPIFYAALYHHPLSVAEFLIEKNPNFDINWKDKFGRNVVAAFLWDFDKIEADWESSRKWLQMLIKKGATFDFHFDRPLPDALAIGWVLHGNYIDYFTTKSNLGVTPLIFALHNFHIKLVTFLLTSGASPNLADTTGLTPLMHAVKLNEEHLVKVLLNYTWTKPVKEEESKQNQPVLAKKLSRTVFNVHFPLKLIQIEEEKEEEMAKADNVANILGSSSEEEEDVVEVDEMEDDKSSAGSVVHSESSHDTDAVADSDEDEDFATEQQKPSLQKKISLLQRLSSKKEYATVDKTSTVDVTCVDGLGWNVIHHVVASLDYGTFDNEELIYILAKAGASVTQKDKAGLSPLDHALIRGAPKSAAMIQKLMEIPEEKYEKPSKGTFEVKDPFTKDDTVVNYKKDSEKFLEDIYSRVMDTSEEMEVPVDSNCNFASSGSVYVDPKSKVPFDVLMSKVNVASGFYGRYSFYKMQVLHQKGKDIFVLFTRWGRIGDIGEYQHTPYPTAEEAAKEFCKIFKSKSGNDWQNLDSFVNQPKKYRLIHCEAKKKVPSVELDLTSKLPSKLSPQVLDLMKEMCDKSMLEQATRKIGLDPSLMPFGQIKREVLLEARKILQQLGELISIVEKQESNLLSEVQNELQTNVEKICKLTNEYYHLIPMDGYSHDKIEPIDKKETLKHHLRLLSNLLDLEVASKILLGAQYQIKDMNPFDYIYKAINCKIQPLLEETIETQYLLGYIRASDPSVKPHAIFKLSRPGEEESINAKNLKNHRLLFHGSNMGNFISILNRGLLVAPVDVPITGHLFGEGIYTSDCFVKSNGYSSNYSSTSNINLMLVSEVALGKCKQTDDFDQDDIMDPEYNSLKIHGRKQPDPLFDVALPYGTTIPLGIMSDVKDEKRPYCSYNEYIVHDSSQICLRYLIMYTP
ncbi:poly [ADP-ribose] polymerase tankyrase [Patella vulgata]|uniref:poly [ADP-ribose] polymerase tankyrase n=1 Tax=Patella vulgata TaxID=6465 RepID=UPI0024A7DC4B|nr:poly [ADP-ribose] polymerase tankyrase [Patella vulgata]